MRGLAIIAVLLAACGGEEEPAKKPVDSKAAGAAPTAPGAGSGSGRPLVVYPKIEGSVQITCPVPRKSSKGCDPKALRPIVLPGEKPDPNDKSCPEEQYCLPTSEGYLCGPCPERDSIRHEFKDRDFAAETNRDPFQPLIGKQAGSGSGDLPRDTTTRCVRADQIRVANWGYQSLVLVGIVAQGTQRKVLMMAPDNKGWVIKRGDCVGKEKAWVKDIGENFICFEVQADPAAVGVRPPDAVCLELHTKQTNPDSVPTEIPQPQKTAPTIAPPGPPAPPTQPPTITPPPRTGSGSGGPPPTTIKPVQ